MKRYFQLTVLALMLAIIGFAVSLPGVSAQLPAVKPVDFNREIRPILSDNCFACHGPDEKQRKAKLRFDNKDGAFAKQGVIVPGDATQSRIIRRITSTDAEVIMPPPDSGYKLTEQQIGLLKRWIDEGANWTEHWAYIAPKRPELPKVSNPGWVRNPIDNFILARLDKEGLKPSVEADKVTLLRRVTYDLTGLPPTPAEVDSFLADQAPDAYEKRVDRLLASPRYGERMAMQWLDLARYADTHGYHIDSHRVMWPWRDWLIKAFNTNKPFDQFTIEQLAGDLLPPASTPEATLNHKIASGFNRNHMINFEGGAIPEEYQVEYVIDRVETTANTWLGMTMGCARCHSHKYDPISQKEFYQFFAFFNTVDEKGLDGRDGNAKPFLSLPTPEQKVRQDELAAAIKVKEKAFASEVITPLVEKWQDPLLGKFAEAPRTGLTTHYELDGSFADATGHYQHGKSIKGEASFYQGAVGRGVSLNEQTQVTFGNVGSLENNEPFTLSVWFKPSLSNVGAHALQKIADAKTRRGYELLLDGISFVEIQKRAAPVTFRLTSKWPDEAIQIRGTQLLVSGQWSCVTLTYNGSGKAAGLKLFVNGQPDQIAVEKDSLSGAISNNADLQIGNKLIGKPYSGGVDDLRIYDRVLTSSEIEQLAIHYPIQAILSGIYGNPSKDEKERVREYFLTRTAPESLRHDYAELKSLKQEKEALDKSILSVMVMSELKQARATFILGRGDYRNKTEKVTPGVPAVLPPLPKGTFINRLALAKWLVAPTHPLTARVAVNRYWQMYFGFGIVKTLEDFGSQGESPVNQELLDWLAVEFMQPAGQSEGARGRRGDGATGRRGDAATRGLGDTANNPQSAIQFEALPRPQSSGWDIKAMQRLIVTSATYRQSSKITPELHEKDPENRLLARGPRFRLPAEMVRDNALAVSGLLNEQIGGPSVLPYHPKGLWEEMAFGDGFTAQEYVQGKGSDLYRRTMYTFWKRTVPPPTLVTFDAPDREKCIARRTLTNTPLQALILLNDPTYVEAARALAQRALHEGGTDVNSRLAYAFRLATARQPVAAELGVLHELLNQQLDRYRSDRKAANDLLHVGESPADARIDQSELAAWTMLASAILNLDETITKE